MRKTFLAVTLAFLAGMLGTYCGGDGGNGPTDPAEAAALFENPDGTVSEENAQEVMDGALAWGQAEALQGMFGGLPVLPKMVVTKSLKALNLRHRADELPDLTACFTFNDDGTEVAVDLSCDEINAALAEEGCSASGELVAVLGETTVDVNFNDVTFECPEFNAAEINGSISIAFDGNVQEGGSPTVACIDISLEVDGEEESFTGCMGLDEEHAGYLVTIDNGSVVVVNYYLEDSCAKVCVDATDSTGSVFVRCPVVAPADGCEVWYQITEIDGDGCTYGEGTCGAL